MAQACVPVGRGLIPFTCLQFHTGRGPMPSLRQPVRGTATGRRDKVQPVGDRPVPTELWALLHVAYAECTARNKSGQSPLDCERSGVDGHATCAMG